jgi:iron-sulfur cluster insertion protein
MKMKHTTGALYVSKNIQSTLTITESAATRIAFLLKSENADTKFRVAVDGGGCSGFQYKFGFDVEQNDDDIVLTAGDATVLIDEISMDFVKGSELNFVNELGGSFFAVQNPNATASCGCGNSFAV